MDRIQKATELEHLKKRFKSDDIVLVVHYDGLTVAQVSLLRREMQSKGCSRPPGSVPERGFARITPLSTTKQQMRNKWQPMLSFPNHRCRKLPSQLGRSGPGKPKRT